MAYHKLQNYKQVSLATVRKMANVWKGLWWYRAYNILLSIDIELLLTNEEINKKSDVLHKYSFFAYFFGIPGIILK